MNAYQLAAQPDLHLLPRRAEHRRHRVEGVLAGHLMVGMDLGGAPVGDLVGWAVPPGQGLALLLPEDRQRLTAGGAGHPLPDHLPAPPLGCGPHLRQAGEIAAFKKAHAAYSPWITSPSFWLKVGQTKLCLE